VTDDFGIWKVDEATKGSERLQEAERTGTEALLEDILVENPAMLMPGLKLVGRQTPTANGYLDLLGVDSDGQLVVFELKRGKLTRDAVAQAVDYASWLESLDDAALGKLVAENSGQRGIDKIENFEEWFDSKDNWNSMESLRPVRIVLVGLGADEPAKRMAGWLAVKGVAIDLLTFLGYRSGNRMFLARQLESGDGAPEGKKRDQDVSRNAMKQEQWREALNKEIDRHRMRDWWDSVLLVLARNFKQDPKAGLAITFHTGKKLTLAGGIVANATHKIRIAGPGKVEILFFPAAVDLCLQEFEKLKRAIPFECEPPSNAPPTELVTEQWGCRLDEGGWTEHKERIAELVRLVDERWREAAEQPLL